MTGRELAEMLDREGTLVTLAEGLTLTVRIVDARYAFGRLLLEVETYEGSRAWVNGERVTLKDVRT